MSDNLKRIIRGFGHPEPRATPPARTLEGAATTLPAKKRKTGAPASPRDRHPDSLPDLQPSLAANLHVVFVGYNPGVELSRQQHHYAHFSNLFWKLFNQSKLLEAVVPNQDTFLQQINGKTTAQHDFQLAPYGIGFTDLVLRCTRTAQELTASEKLQNVPRLLREFRHLNCKVVVFIGKGIWEVVVRYMSQVLATTIRLTGFEWGEQTGSGDYRRMVHKLRHLCGGLRVYVFPNTLGLVTSLTFKEKLQMWEELAGALQETDKTRDARVESPKLEENETKDDVSDASEDASDEVAGLP